MSSNFLLMMVWTFSFQTQDYLCLFKPKIVFKSTFPFLDSEKKVLQSFFRQLTISVKKQVEEGAAPHYYVLYNCKKFGTF